MVPVGSGRAARVTVTVRWAPLGETTVIGTLAPGDSVWISAPRSSEVFTALPANDVEQTRWLRTGTGRAPTGTVPADLGAAAN